ncbi:MAG: sigma-54-dependent Fis family transcriptional regulator [Planctomycetes bacterium]|nr:sigma-54-dependent Fis family transcriptional regulator [Planctomycetota bacterium]
MSEPERTAAEAAIAVLIVDDEVAYRRVLQRELERRGHVVTTAGSVEEGLAALSAGMPDVVLLDLRMAGVGGIGFLQQLRERGGDSEVIILTGYPSLESAVDAVRSGIFDYRTKPIDLDTLEGVVRRAAERRSLLRENRALRRALAPGAERAPIASGSAVMQRFWKSLPRIAASSSTVLVHGETGSGKELVARELHRLSPRRDEPFVVVDCAALQSSVRGAELFGCEKGAFTGADTARPGLFEAAHRGTVFLDEIGELDLEAQAALLRVLESGDVRRVGAIKSRPVDVRVVAATHRDLAAEVVARRFREDLLFRLQVVQLDLPPLRERAEDILPLFDHFLAAAAGSAAPRLSDAARAALVAYRWPGNVREVRNLAEMLAVTADAETVEVHDLPRRLVAAPAGAPARLAAESGAETGDGAVETLAALERRQILAVYEQTGRNKRRAAELLGISLRTLYNKLAEYLGGDATDRTPPDSGASLA